MKRDDDAKTALRTIEERIAPLNASFPDIKLTLFHEYTKIMSPYERMNNNTFINRYFEVGIDCNMGYDCVLHSENSSSKKIIAIRRWIDSSLFYKKPRGIELTEFNDIILKNIYFLILDYSNYHLILTADLLKYATSMLETTKGNRNRINFYDKKGQIISPKNYYPIPIKGCRGLIYKQLSLYDALKELNP